jgi:hypothetical protein
MEAKLEGNGFHPTPKRFCSIAFEDQDLNAIFFQTYNSLVSNGHPSPPHSQVWFLQLLANWWGRHTIFCHLPNFLN